MQADEVPEAVAQQMLEEMIEKKSAGAPVVKQVMKSLANHRAAVRVNELLNKSLFLDVEADPAKREDPVSQERLEGLLNTTYELFCIEPSLVARMLPNLHADLQCTNPDRRRAFTALTAQLLAHQRPDASGRVTGLLLRSLI